MQCALPDVFPHGGGIEAAARRIGCPPQALSDLSTGLHPAGPPAWLAHWLAAHSTLASHYPDADGEPARSALAEACGVEAQQVLITAGAQAVIEVVFQAMRWSSVSLRIPCYHEPIRCARRAGCRLIPYLRGEPVPVAEACWLISPSNPFGDVQPFPSGMTGVWDESYMEFAQRRRTGLIPGVIRLGSLTKLFCIPGLRLGYVIAETALIERLRQWLPPWPASSLCLHLLPALLPEADARDAEIRRCRQQLARLLRRYGWQVFASQASFILARPPATPLPAADDYQLLLRHFPEWPQLGAAIRFGLPGSPRCWQRLEVFLAAAAN